ncbi:MAG: hypothetical protein ACQERN_04285 [Thermodesulfobacteriota bacterium]
MLTMNHYQLEQRDALHMIRQQLDKMPAAEKEGLRRQIADYLRFRFSVAEFMAVHLSQICDEKCYRSRLSACCSKDGIVTFFADWVVNVLDSDDGDLDAIGDAICRPQSDFKCIFLTDTGCLWRVKPIVCEMFLCHEAKNRAFDDNPAAARQWEQFLGEKKRFTWPDQPVLFEHLESHFIARGLQSPLMYIHYSPGLKRIKQQRAAG